MDERSFLLTEFADKDARRQYAAELLDSFIALQLKTLRQQRAWSQEHLAQLAGKHQSQISAMEQIDFTSWKISTLRQLAEAFDLALVVRFESFGRFLDDVLPVERGALERPSFADDPGMSSSTSLPSSLDGEGITNSCSLLQFDHNYRATRNKLVSNLSSSSQRIAHTLATELSPSEVLESPVVSQALGNR